MNRTALPLSLLLLSFCSCSSPEAAPMADTAAAEASENGFAAPAPAAGESNVGPIAAHGGEVAAAPAAAPEAGGEIAFDLPKSWSSQPPSSKMRLAQATIPGPGGPGDFALFFFGPGEGGSAELNLERWVGQMENPPEPPKTETFESNGYRVTFLDIKGTLKPSMMGNSPSTPQPGSRLLGAVVEGPGGPWFFKATGPEATIAAERDAFLTMVKSVRVKGGVA